MLAAQGNTRVECYFIKTQVRDVISRDFSFQIIFLLKLGCFMVCSWDHEWRGLMPVI